MSYPSYGANSESVHTLMVTGKIGPEAARVLVETQEKLTQLGHKAELVLKIEPSEPKEVPAKTASA